MTVREESCEMRGGSAILSSKCKSAGKERETHEEPGVRGGVGSGEGGGRHCTDSTVFCAT